jgi:hypothetical protein
MYARFISGFGFFLVLIVSRYRTTSRQANEDVAGILQELSGDEMLLDIVVQVERIFV